MVRLREHSHTGTQHKFVTCHTYIWNLTVGFERLILINYGHNQTVGFGERCGQSLVKVGQTRSNLIDGPETIGHDEIHIQILVIGIEEYDDILVLVKFKTNWMVRLREHSHIGTQHISITRHT